MKKIWLSIILAIFATLVIAFLWNPKAASYAGVGFAFAIWKYRKELQQEISLPQLNTPIKRIGFIVLIIGVLLFIVGLIPLAFDSSYLEDFFKNLKKALLFTGYQYKRFLIVQWGFYLAIFGFFLLYLFDSTLGRLFIWIKGNNGK